MGRTHNKPTQHSEETPFRWLNTGTSKCALPAEVTVASQKLCSLLTATHVRTSQPAIMFPVGSKFNQLIPFEVIKRRCLEMDSDLKWPSILALSHCNH